MERRGHVMAYVSLRKMGMALEFLLTFESKYIRRSPSSLAYVVLNQSPVALLFKSVAVCLVPLTLSVDEYERRVCALPTLPTFDTVSCSDVHHPAKGGYRHVSNRHILP